MSLAIPDSTGSFSLLQHALKPGACRVLITPGVKDQLKDLHWMAKSLVLRPMHIAEVVPTPPTYYGAVDAAKAGMGRVWFPPMAPEPLALQPPIKDCLQAPLLW